MDYSVDGDSVCLSLLSMHWKAGWKSPGPSSIMAQAGPFTQEMISLGDRGCGSSSSAGYTARLRCSYLVAALLPGLAQERGRAS